MEKETNDPSESDATEVSPENSNPDSQEVAATTPPCAKEATHTASDEAKAKSKMKLRLVVLGGAIFGMIFGAVIEMFAQGAMESTGFFGPTLDSVLEQQETNFTSIQAKLAELSATKDEKERSRIQKELDTLFKSQEKIANSISEELGSSQNQIESLRLDSLATQGSAGGADLCLKSGESISVGTRQNVFSFTGLDAYHQAKINLSGQAKVLELGSFVEASTPDGNWKVFYKQKYKGEDRNHSGFDVVRPE